MAIKYESLEKEKKQTPSQKKKAKGIKKSKEIIKGNKNIKKAIQAASLKAVKVGGSIGNNMKGEIDRNALYLIGLIQGKTKYAAAKAAGFAESSALNAKCSIESIGKFKNVKEAFTEELVKQGVTIETMSGALAQMLNKKESSFTKDGSYCKGTQIDSSSANMAINGITKLLGLNAPEKKLVVIADLRDVEEMSEPRLDEELRKMIESS